MFHFKTLTEHWKSDLFQGRKRVQLLGILPKGISGFLADPSLYLSPEVWLSAFLSTPISVVSADRKKTITGSIPNISGTICKGLNQSPFKGMEKLVSVWLVRHSLGAYLSLEDCYRHLPVAFFLEGQDNSQKILKWLQAVSLWNISWDHSQSITYSFLVRTLLHCQFIGLFHRKVACFAIYKLRPFTELLADFWH